ncbi:MAG: glycosyltransferase family 2 protein [Arachnia sp.]
MKLMQPQPLTTRPSVRVVVPCYNYGHHLAQLAAMVLDQPGLDVDILIVDDASPDGSLRAAQALAATQPRVSVIAHETNTGHISTYNDGLATVDSDYVVLLSADDLLPPGALTRAVALMEHHRQVGLVYGFARSFDDGIEEPDPGSGKVRSWSVWSGFDWLRTSMRQGRCFISSPEVVMRTAALRQVGGYDPRQPHSGDLDMWLRTALAWNIGRVNGPVQALYRVHAANMHLTTYAGWAHDLRARRTTFGILLDEHAADRHDVQALAGDMHRALAREAVRRALTAAREDPGCDAATELAEFAVETYPDITSSLAWREWQFGPAQGRAMAWQRPRGFLTRAADHLRWRRWRAYGI